MNQTQARSELLRALRLAEKNLIVMMKSGQTGKLDDPFVALTALVVTTGFVVDGGTMQMSVYQIAQMQTFITTCPDYEPSKDFPFTKQQMKDALEATK